MDSEELHSLIVNGSEITLIDVRENEEFTTGYIETAQHIPLGEIASHIGELQGKKVVVYCQKGGRASLAADKLQAHGIDAVSAGGVEQWVEAGYSLITE